MILLYWIMAQSQYYLNSQTPNPIPAYGYFHPTYITLLIFSHIRPGKNIPLTTQLTRTTPTYSGKQERPISGVGSFQMPPHTRNMHSQVMGKQAPASSLLSAPSPQKTTQQIRLYGTQPNGPSTLGQTL